MKICFMFCIDLYIKEMSKLMLKHQAWTQNNFLEFILFERSVSLRVKED